MKILFLICILFLITGAHGVCQNKSSSDSIVPDFKYLRLNYNNHFGTVYSLTIDSVGTIVWRHSPEVIIGDKIITRVTGKFSKPGFERFKNKLTQSLIQLLAELKNGCGIDAADKKIDLKFGSESISGEGCSSAMEVALFFQYLNNIPANKDFINRKKG